LKGKNITPFTVDEALAHMVNCRMTKNVYHQTRLGLKNMESMCILHMTAYEKQKKPCYPEGLKIYEYSAFIPLQNVLDHTVRRIFQTFDLTEILIFSKNMLRLSLFLN
jgi:hypothetical protein